MMVAVKIIKGLVYFILTSVLVFVCLITIFSLVGIPGGYRVFMVQSGSMEPIIKTGSLVLIKSSDTFSKGEVVTFLANPNEKLSKKSITVTHRIYSIDEKTGKFITKGDKNKTPDSEPIYKGQILGKMLFFVPYLGYLVDFAKTQIGFICLVIIPGTLIIYSELLSIKNEAKRLIEERKKRKLSAREKVIKSVGEEEIIIEKGIKKFFRKFRHIIPIVFIFLLQVGATCAFLSDSEKSEGNVLSIGTWNEVPSPSVSPEESSSPTATPVEESATPSPSPEPNPT